MGGCRISLYPASSLVSSPFLPDSDAAPHVTSSAVTPSAKLGSIAVQPLLHGFSSLPLHRAWLHLRKSAVGWLGETLLQVSTPFQQPQDASATFAAVLGKKGGPARISPFAVHPGHRRPSLIPASPSPTFAHTHLVLSGSCPCLRAFVLVLTRSIRDLPDPRRSATSSIQSLRRLLCLYKYRSAHLSSVSISFPSPVFIFALVRPSPSDRSSAANPFTTVPTARSTVPCRITLDCSRFSYSDQRPSFSSDPRPSGQLRSILFKSDPPLHDPFLPLRACRRPHIHCRGFLETSFQPQLSSKLPP